MSMNKTIPDSINWFSWPMVFLFFCSSPTQFYKLYKQLNPQSVLASINGTSTNTQKHRSTDTVFEFHWNEHRKFTVSSSFCLFIFISIHLFNYWMERMHDKQTSNNFYEYIRCDVITNTNVLPVYLLLFFLFSRYRWFVHTKNVAIFKVLRWFLAHKFTINSPIEMILLFAWNLRGRNTPKWFTRDIRPVWADCLHNRTICNRFKLILCFYFHNFIDTIYLAIQNWF